MSNVLKSISEVENYVNSRINSLKNSYDYINRDFNDGSIFELEFFLDNLIKDNDIDILEYIDKRYSYVSSLYVDSKLYEFDYLDGQCFELLLLNADVQGIKNIEEW